MEISYADSATYMSDSDQNREPGSQKTHGTATNVFDLSPLKGGDYKKSPEVIRASDERGPKEV
jgi:hypothetical protein